MGTEPATIYKCPACGAYIWMSKAKLGITNGIYRWSDMYQEEQYFSVPDLFKCWRCGEVYWSMLLSNTAKNYHLAYLHDPDKVEHLDDFFENDNVFFYESLDLSDYHHILQGSSLLSKKMEKYVRTLYLWEYNMRFRFEENGTKIKQHSPILNDENGHVITKNSESCNIRRSQDLDHYMKDNMKSLIQMLENEPNVAANILRAELYRELEMYEDAKSVLEEVVIKKSRYPRDDFRRWCDEECPCVRGFVIPISAGVMRMNCFAEN